MKVSEIYSCLDQIAPFAYAEPWDNCGILVGDPHGEVTSVTLALDVTPQVIADALSHGSQLLITHHPILFRPAKSIPIGSPAYRLVSQGLHLISAHTNLDFSPQGVNTALGSCLALQDIVPLTIQRKIPHCTVTVYLPSTHVQPMTEALAKAGAGEIGNYSGCAFLSQGEGRFFSKTGATPYVGSVETGVSLPETAITCSCREDQISAIGKAIASIHPYETPVYHIAPNLATSTQVTLGGVGNLAVPQTAEAFAHHVKQVLGVEQVALSHPDKQISRVAFCGGEGSDFIPAVLSSGADAYVTGELKYNLFVDSLYNGLSLLTAGHFSTENVVLYPLCQLLQEKLPSVKFRVSPASISPISYV